ALPEPAHRLVDAAEPPGIHADPAEVLHGVANMSQFPIEHRPQTVLVHQEVAVPEIAVHQRGARWGIRQVLSQPPDGQLEDRPSMTVATVAIDVDLEFGLGWRVAQARRLSHVDSMDGCKRVPALPGQPCPG